MITKAAFFALLNDPANKVGVTAHSAVIGNINSGSSLIIKQNGAPNTALSEHKYSTTAQAAFTKYDAWLDEWFTAQAEAAQARIDLLAQIESDWNEGEVLAAEIQQDIDVAIAHAEALTINEKVNSMKGKTTEELLHTVNSLYTCAELRLIAQAELQRRAAQPQKKSLRAKLAVVLFLTAGVILGGHADAAERVHMVCGTQQTTVTEHSIIVDGWTYAKPLPVRGDQPVNVDIHAFSDTSGNIAMVVDVADQTYLQTGPEHVALCNKAK